jgi:group I intron endonuclease
MTDGMGLIYIATHKNSGRAYVGQTAGGLLKRLKTHLHASSTSYFSNALRQYGTDGFAFRVIPCPARHLNEVETLLITALGSKAPAGFNLTDGGEGCRGYVQSEEHRQKIARANLGKRFSEEHCRKISEGKTGRPVGLGHPVSDETRRRVSEAHKGKPLSAEHRKKISEGLMGRHPSEATRKKLHMAQLGNKHNLGKHHSEETKRKIGASNIGKHPMTPERLAQLFAGKTRKADL